MNTKFSHFLLRVLALALDLLVADLVLIIILKATGQNLNSLNPFVATILVLVLWFIVISPILYSAWGTTLGTWLLKIKITNQAGGKLGFWQALIRLPRAKVVYENLGLWRLGIVLAITFLFYGGGLLSVLR